MRHWRIPSLSSVTCLNIDDVPLSVTAEVILFKIGYIKRLRKLWVKHVRLQLDRPHGTLEFQNGNGGCGVQLAVATIG